ncbi:hypothetical protein [Methylobacterium nigriterrae]|uniref:hypothetical protein n=1 Tax=Methylobacterium nigriterrae TaxID=3127512 RepID=UPI003013CD2C
MSFLLRAALVIGTLSYLAAQRGMPGVSTPPSPAAIQAALPSVAGALPAAVDAVSAVAPATRERMAREGLAELGRHLGGSASRDTLAEADRRPAWRGAEAR